MKQRKKQKESETFNVEEALKNMTNKERMLLETTFETYREEGESFEEYLQSYYASSSTL